MLNKISVENNFKLASLIIDTHTKMIETIFFIINLKSDLNQANECEPT